MDIEHIAAVIDEKVRELNAPLPLEWRYPPRMKAPADPLSAKPKRQAAGGGTT